MHYQHTLFGTLVDGNVTLLPLRNWEKQVIAYAMVDTADAEWVSQWRWYRSGKGYAVRNGGVEDHYRTILLHRDLLGLPRIGREPQVDHINRDRLDNRRANLRVGSAQLNAENRPSLGGSSQYRGVYWHTAGKRWRAVGVFSGVPFTIGSWHTELEAARAAACWRAVHMPGAVEDPALLEAGPPAPLGRRRSLLHEL